MKSIRLNILAAFALIFCLFGCDTQFGDIPGSYAYYVRYFGTDGSQKAVDLVPLTAGYLILGESTSGTQTKVYLSLTDAEGYQLWGLVYNTEDNLNYFPKAVIPSSDGNYVVVGNVLNNAEQDVFLMRIGTSGVQIETRIFGEQGVTDIANDIIEVSLDNSFIVAGTSVYDPEIKDVGMTAWRTLPGYSFDLLPETEWARTFKKGQNNEGVSILESGSNFYMFGTSDGNTQNQSLQANNLTIYPISQYGINQNQEYFGTVTDDFGIMMLKDVNRFIFLGKTINGTNETFFIQQVSEKFHTLAKIQLTSQRQVIPTSIAISDSDFVVLGTEDVFVDDTDIYLSKVGIGGEIIWEKSFGAIHMDSGSSGLHVTPQGDIIFVATVELDKQYKIALIKVSSKGEFE